MGFRVQLKKGSVFGVAPEIARNPVGYPHNGVACSGVGIAHAHSVP